MLTGDEIAELEAAVEQLSAGGKALVEIEANDRPLRVLEPALRDWLRELDLGRGFVLVRGLPVERWGKEKSALAWWLIGRHLGEPVSQNSNGDLLGHVRDDGSTPGDPGIRLYRTRAAQDFHTDGADIIGLLCLQPAKSGGLSRIASSVTVFNEILARRPDLAPALFEDFAWNAYGQQAGGAPPHFTMPICSVVGGRLRTFYIGWYIRDAQGLPEAPRMSPAQAEVVDLVEKIAGDPRFHLDMDFRPGDMQLLKNSVTLHARTEYQDWEDAARKRHLLRLWLTAREFDDGDETLRAGIPKKG